MDNVKLMRCSHTLWEQFRRFHYWPDIPLNKAARCYLVEVHGKRIGFAASLPKFGRTGYDKTAVWNAHKTVILLPKSHPAYYKLWAMAADAQAQLHKAEGHRFYGVAPVDHAAYRDSKTSGWQVTRGDKGQLVKKCRSHEYIGTKEDKPAKPFSDWPERKSPRFSHEYIGEPPEGVTVGEWKAMKSHERAKYDTLHNTFGGNLYVHEYFDRGAYDGSNIWLVENTDTGKAELWRTCDLNRIAKNGGKHINKCKHGAHRLYGGARNPETGEVQGGEAWWEWQKLKAQKRLEEIKTTK
jgi:hypothetical protein